MYVTNFHHLEEKICHFKTFSEVDSYAHVGQLLPKNEKLQGLKFPLRLRGCKITVGKTNEITI